MTALYADAAVMAHIAAPMSEEAAGAYFERLLRHTRRPPVTARAHFWALSHARTGEALGIVSLVRDAEGSRSGEIGVMLLPQAQASGLAIHALEALIEALVQDRWGFGLSRLWGRHAPDNRGAARVACHLGLLPTGALRDGQTERVLAHWVWAAHASSQTSTHSTENPEHA